MRVLTLFGTFLALLVAQPAAAQVSKSFCGFESLGKTELLGLADTYLSGKEVPRSFIDRVVRLADDCAKRVDPKVGKSDDFVGFVFAETVTTVMREYLLGQGYDMDGFDRVANLSCNEGLFPADGNAPDGARPVLQNALAAGKIPEQGTSNKVIDVLASYMVAAPDRWRRGIAMGLLPGCSKSSQK